MPICSGGWGGCPTPESPSGASPRRLLPNGQDIVARVTGPPRRRLRAVPVPPEVDLRVLRDLATGEHRLDVGLDLLGDLVGVAAVIDEGPHVALHRAIGVRPAR